MKSTLKIWTQLGLGTALAGGVLSACSDEAGGEGSGGEGAGTQAVAPGEGAAAIGGSARQAVRARAEWRWLMRATIRSPMALRWP